MQASNRHSVLNYVRHQVNQKGIVTPWGVGVGGGGDSLPVQDFVEKSPAS